MKATGRHLLAEYHGCDRALLNDIGKVERLLNEAARAAKATVVDSVFHLFSPQGVSGVVVIEESHLSVHTWPEHGYAAVDFFTCGECVPERAHEVIMRGLGAAHAETMLITRGLVDEPFSMRVDRHDKARPPAGLRAADGLTALGAAAARKRPLSIA